MCAATVLKKPLHTSIAVEMDEFDNINLPEQHHIILSVKDFRNILQHAQVTSGELAADYSDSGRPMRLKYESDGVSCKFILMTVLKEALAGGQRGRQTAAARGNQAPRAQLEAAAPSASYRPKVAASGVAASRPSQPVQNDGPAQQQRAPPVRAQRQSQFQIRPPPLPPASTLRSDSLFVTQDNDDQVWEPVNPEDEDDGEDIARLEWDPNHVSHSSPFPEDRLVTDAGPRIRPRRAYSTTRLLHDPPSLDRRTWTRCSSLVWSPRSACPKSAALDSSRRRKRPMMLGDNVLSAFLRCVSLHRCLCCLCLFDTQGI